MYIHIYMDIYMYIYMYIYIYIYICIFIHTCIHVYECFSDHTHTSRTSCFYKYLCIDIYIFGCIRSNVYTYICVCIHIYVCVCTHILGTILTRHAFHVPVVTMLTHHAHPIDTCVCIHIRTNVCLQRAATRYNTLQHIHVCNKSSNSCITTQHAYESRLCVMSHMRMSHVQNV